MLYFICSPAFLAVIPSIKCSVVVVVHFYIKLCNCLKTRFCNVSVVIGAVADVDQSSADDVSHTEDRIVSRWRELSADQQSDLRERVDEIFRPLGLQTRLIVLERANSIALYFICLTLSAVMRVRHEWCTGHLRDMVQSLFTFLSGATRPVPVKRLTWPVADYERCLEFFSSVPGNQMLLS